MAYKKITPYVLCKKLKKLKRFLGLLLQLPKTKDKKIVIFAKFKYFMFQEVIITCLTDIFVQQKNLNPKK